MVIRGKIKKGEYFDSVTLMKIGKEISNTPGVLDVAVVMGTKENQAILEASNLLIPEFKNVSDSDLLIGIKAENEKILDEIFGKVDEHLRNVRKTTQDKDQFNPKSIEGALKISPDANIALISIAGKYAGAEAMKALEQGLHVMLFSDNVSLETEIALKKYGKQKGLLVMGPDCGTAIINGVPLAFANVVNRGNIGIVAASGTGLQELTSIISNEGAGISQAIGTGGRDVKKDVGGITFIQAIEALAEDLQTEVIILAAKPPHETVIEKIANEIRNIKKKVIAVFLGADPAIVEKYGIVAATTFEETALKAVAFAKKQPDFIEVTKRLKAEDQAIKELAQLEVQKCRSTQKYLRGLFSGGTFCAEAQVILQNLSINDLYANAPLGKTSKLSNSLKSEKNTLVDLGEDEFTVGRPHPMIDYSLRNKKIIAEAIDPQVAVILLDVVLGYGSHQDPASELVPVISKACKNARIICSITGTDQDPQNRGKVTKLLKEAGAIVMPTNAAASKLAGYIIYYLESGKQQ